MRISDWSSDVCSSDLKLLDCIEAAALWFAGWVLPVVFVTVVWFGLLGPLTAGVIEAGGHSREGRQLLVQLTGGSVVLLWTLVSLYRYHRRSEEHTLELQSLMRTSSAVF